ncbi:ubiquitin-like domain-containing CTD phosphatase 1 isoform X1 [Corticium candelabrum]|uniref:ubiquitin-like domain-containing CTD phosphatase 1 isoform X1 n=1 Tax=Corticium candelabrum TaxID=121492 RepID=UPI002E25C1CF|nr:ubiquitin-like domain-containing CTD phosphatase 1 isoform X1 [Corticium candelabrum]
MSLSVTVKWCGKEFVFDKLRHSTTVYSLKLMIYEKTGVLPHRQTLLGRRLKLKAKPKQGKEADDVRKLIDVGVQNGMKIMMMGTREEDMKVEVLSPPEHLQTEVVDDFDIEDEMQIQERPEYLQKIEHRVKEYQVHVLNESRPGKKLLVLDVDYTLFGEKWMTTVLCSLLLLLFVRSQIYG